MGALPEQQPHHCCDYAACLRLQRLLLHGLLPSRLQAQQQPGQTPSAPGLRQLSFGGDRKKWVITISCHVDLNRQVCVQSTWRDD